MDQKEGKYLTKRARRSNITAIISICLVLFVFGLFGLIFLNANNLSNYVKENLLIQVYFNSEVKEADVLKFKTQIEQTAFAKAVEYVSKEDASEILKADLGPEYIDILDYNPLLPSFNININSDFVHPDSIQQVIKFLEAGKDVNEVIYQKTVLEQINKNVSSIGLFLLSFSTLLLFITLTLINNAIRLALFSRRFAIKSMQLVGATRSFIQKPFLLRALGNGIVAAALAILLILGANYLAQQNLPELKSLANPIELIYLFGIIFAVSIIISILSTFFAINKYLNQSIDKLY